MAAFIPRATIHAAGAGVSARSWCGRFDRFANKIRGCGCDDVEATEVVRTCTFGAPFRIDGRYHGSGMADVSCAGASRA